MNYLEIFCLFFYHYNKFHKKNRFIIQCDKAALSKCLQNTY